MTNDERHIAVLNRMLENMDVYDSIQPTTERKKAIKAAIKALEQQPCDDAVSREAVIEILENYGCTNREGLIFKDIRALPPVTQKSGKWIDIPFSHYYKCSECDKYQISATNYCPNCGAKMQAESEEV